MTARRFEIKTAVREEVPLIVGLAGPSGSGKTYSALRLATGMAKASGRKLAVIDTENRRAAHYADDFEFGHLDFQPPHDPASYLQAVQATVAAGYGVIVIDSLSHEHEGIGGVLEMHAANVERMSRGDYKKAEKVKFAAWIEPKRERNRLLLGLLASGAHLVLCFRAKEKLRIRVGKEPLPLGWMPIGGEEFAFETTVFLTLHPGADGVPALLSREPGEEMLRKVPRPFRQLIDGKHQMSEDMGAALAEWAAGRDSEPMPRLQAAGASLNILQAFAPHGVTIDDLHQWAGCDLEQITAQQRRALRDMYAALETREAKPGEFFPRLREESAP